MSVVVQDFVLVGIEADFVVLLLLRSFSVLAQNQILFVLRVNLDCWGLSVFIIPIVEELPGLRIGDQPLSYHRNA